MDCVHARSVFQRWFPGAIDDAVFSADPATRPPQNSNGQTPSTTPNAAPPKLQLQICRLTRTTLTPAEQQQQKQEEAMNAAIRLASLQAHWVRR